MVHYYRPGGEDPVYDELMVHFGAADSAGLAVIDHSACECACEAWEPDVRRRCTAHRSLGRSNACCRCIRRLHA